MLRLAAFLVLALAAVVAGGCAVGSKAPSGFSDLRVCGADTFSTSDSSCRSDQSATALTSGRFYCSARLGGAKQGETFRGRFVYDGIAFPESTRSLPANTGHAWIDLFGGGAPLPGGHWACELDVGSHHARKTFSSGGPTGTVLDVAVCPTDATTRAGPARVCVPGKATTSLPPVSSVTCSATFARVQGRTARLELSYRGKPTSLRFERLIPLPVTAFGVQISKSGQNLPAGPYACIFSLDGKEVARQAFTVAA